MRFLLITLCLVTCLSSSAKGDGVPCQTGQMIGYLDVLGDAEGIAIQGNYAYISGGDTREVYIVDITDPSNPALISTYTSPGSAEHIAVWDDVLVIANESLRIEFIDISDALNPTLIQASMGQRRYRDIEVKNGYLYSTSYAYSTFTIWDIRSPDSIVALGSVSDVRFGLQIAFHDDLVYLADNGLKIIDASDPTDPITLADFEIDEHSIQSIGVFTGANAEPHALTTDPGYLSIINIDDPSNPQIMYTDDDWIPFPTTQTVIEDTTAYMGYRYPGQIKALDLSDPSAPRTIAEYDVRGPVMDFEIDDEGRIYVAAGSGGLQIIEPTTYPSTSTIAEFQAGTRLVIVRDLIARNKYLFLAAGSNGLVIMDIFNMRNPVELSTLTYSSRIYSVEYKDHYVYLGTDGIGIRVIDVRDPYNPIEVGSFPTQQNNDDLLVVGDYLYAVGRFGWIETYSLKNPAMPEHIGTYEGVRVHSFSHANNLLIATSSDFFDSGVYILDTQDPANLTLIHHLEPDFTPIDAVITDEYLYASAGSLGSESSGVHIFDITNIESPVHVNHIHLDLSTDIDLVENTLYVGDIVTGLRMFDITDGANPNLVGWHTPTQARVEQIEIDGYVAHITNGNNDATIVDLRSCGQCTADMDLDQDMDYLDVSYFLAAYYDQSPIADINNDAQWNFHDVSSFIVSYLAGCN